MEYQHRSVLLDECITGLKIRPDGYYVDGTLGGGGHSQEIAKCLTQGGRLIAIDRDRRALLRAGERLSTYKERITYVHGNFKDVRSILQELDIEAVDGMLFDLGVSSPQLDETERGFSYMSDAPLDMRMDESQGFTAYDVVNTWSEYDLRRILYDFGEERYAPRIAQKIIQSRAQKAIATTRELSDLIRSSMPASALREKQHPAKRTFQAIRIAVNGELDAVSEMMETADQCLRQNGRLAVISFHSLEDRIVKNGIARKENGCICPRDFPICTCGFQQTLRNIQRKPILPSDKEILENPRARSAKLRIAERV